MDDRSGPGVRGSKRQRRREERARRKRLAQTGKQPAESSTRIGAQPTPPAVADTAASETKPVLETPVVESPVVESPSSAPDDAGARLAQEVREATFSVRRGSGYHTGDVDDFLRELASALDPQTESSDIAPITADAILRVKFRVVRRRGYDTLEVDTFLDNVRMALPHS